MILLFAFSFKSRGAGDIDSLKIVFEKTIDPTEKFNLGYEIVRTISGSRMDGAKAYYQKCSELSTQAYSAVPAA